MGLHSFSLTRGCNLLDKAVYVLVSSQGSFFLIFAIQELDDVRNGHFALDPVGHIFEHVRIGQDGASISHSQLMVMLHHYGPRSVVSHPVIVPLELYCHWAVKFLSVFNLHSLVYFVRSWLSSSATKRELHHESILIPSNTVLFELYFESETQSIIDLQSLINDVAFNWKVGEVDKHCRVNEFVA